MIFMKKKHQAMIAIAQSLGAGGMGSRDMTPYIRRAAALAI